MAGDRHRQRVGARTPARPRAPTSARRSARRSRRSSRVLPGGNLAQRLPDALLERGAAHVQRQIQAEPRRLDQADHLRHELFEAAVAADQLGARESILQIARQRVRIVAEQDRADAPLAGCDQDRTERAFADREPDLACRRRRRDSATASCPALVGFRVKAAVGVVAGVVDRLGDRAAPFEPGAHPARAMRGGVALGRHAGRPP